MAKVLRIVKDAILIATGFLLGWISYGILSQ